MLINMRPRVYPHSQVARTLLHPLCGLNTEGITDMERKHERSEIHCRATWDFYTSGTGAKNGLITNISPGGCLLKSNELIEHRRWVRILARSQANVVVTLVGRITRCENVVESSRPAEGAHAEVTLFRYGIEFTYAKNALTQEPHQIFAKPEGASITYLAAHARSSARLELPARCPP